MTLRIRRKLSLFICPKPCIRFLDVSRYLWTKFALQLLLWPPYLIGQDIIFSSCGFFFFMVALCNRADHYIFALWFLSLFFFFSSPNLSGRRVDVYHTSTHGVVWPLCEFRMHVWNVLHAARWKYRTQKSRQKSPSRHHRTTLLSGYIFATAARIDNRKKTC